MAMVALLLTCERTGLTWGTLAHDLINRVAVRTLPDDGPVFLKAQEDWVAYLASQPDTWRRPSEPFLKIVEDPNHGWFREQFAAMKEIPRTRYGFVVQLLDLQRQQASAGQPGSSLTNVRWTGTLPYAAVEGYERMLTAMRRWRAAPQGSDRTLVEREIAFYMGWTGHYTADGAQPLHDTIHHDGWQGDNPNGYTTDPRVHGRFESQFVDLMKLTAADFQSQVSPPRLLDDPFSAVLAHLDRAATSVEAVYRLDKRGALNNPADSEARALVVERVASAASLLRDLTYTAWIRSGETPASDPAGNPIVPAHPGYDPATGSAPAHRSPPPGPAPAAESSASHSSWRPIDFGNPVVGKNFFLFEAMKADAAVEAMVASHPELARIRAARVEQLTTAASRCGADTSCHAEAYKWAQADIDAAKAALASLASRPEMKAFVSKRLRPSGMFVRDHAASDADLIGRAWANAARAMNAIIETYALGTPRLYPKIDAASYDVHSETYARLISIVSDVLDDRRDRFTLFWEPTLNFAERLLQINQRDEAGRHEPLHLGENRAAFQQIPSIDWSRYRYALILVPGAGPDRDGVRLDPWARLRLELAVARYRAGEAPLIVVSGGYVHPAQTPYAEAIEMKQSLLREFDIPENAILVDPHARHTTTNLRNTARLMLRYGIPTDRLSLVTTDRFQSAYIEGREFHERCDRELGYQPATIGARRSAFDLEFHARVESLHADAKDPLDP